MEGWRIRDEREAFVYYLQPDLYLRTSQVSGQNKKSIIHFKPFSKPYLANQWYEHILFNIIEWMYILNKLIIATELFTHNLKLVNLVKVLNGI